MKSIFGISLLCYLMSITNSLAQLLPQKYNYKNVITKWEANKNEKISSNVPILYKEDFESIPALTSVTKIQDFLPALGWTVVSGGNNLDFEAYYLEGLTGYSGSYYMYSPYDKLRPRNEWAISPGIPMKKEKVYLIELWGNLPGYGTTIDEFKVVIGTAPKVENMHVVIIDKSGKNKISTLLNWERFSGSFFPEKDGIYHIGINHCSTKNGEFVAFDNILVREIPYYGVETGFIYSPFIEYTQIPSFWHNVPLSIQFSYYIKNIGRNILQKWSSTNTVYQSQNKISSKTYPINYLDSATIDTLSFQHIYTPSQTQKLYNFSVNIKNEKNETMASLSSNEVATPLLTENLLARDNGTIGSVISLSIFGEQKNNARLGQKFEILKKTTVNAISFSLLGEFSTAKTTCARIYKINRTSVVEYATSSKKKLLTDPKGYTEYIIDIPGGVELEPGTYIASLDEAKDESLGLALSTNYTGENLAFSLDANNWNVLPATAFLRLIVADPNSSFINSNENTKIYIYATKDKLYVKNATIGSTINVFDMTGNRIYTNIINTENSSIPQTFATGLYIIQVDNVVKKIVIQ